MFARYLSLLLLALLLGARHPTPTVVMVKQTDLLRAALGGSGAKQFFVRKVTIGKDDLARIRREVDFSPEDPDLSFYLGKDATGRLVGVTLFPQVNTMHGPLEVGLTLKPDGSIASVAVTRATVETKPWVEEAIASQVAEQPSPMAPSGLLEPEQPEHYEAPAANGRRLEYRDRRRAPFSLHAVGGDAGLRGFDRSAARDDLSGSRSQHDRLCQLFGNAVEIPRQPGIEFSL